MSSRTCLRVEKVQGCRPALLNSIWLSESQSCRLRVAAVFVSLPSYDLCHLVVLTAMLLWSFLDYFGCIMCQPAQSGKIYWLVLVSIS